MRRSPFFSAATSFAKQLGIVSGKAVAQKRKVLDDLAQEKVESAKEA